MMSGESGLDICRRIPTDRRFSIIIISAMGGDIDRILGLELGADHYFSKPFNPRELLAQIRAIVRRRSEFADSKPVARGYSFRGWRLDVIRRELFSPQGVLVQLSTGDFRLLEVFAENPMQILRRSTIMAALDFKQNESYDRVIDVMVSRLRRRLDLHEGIDELIQTLRGEGYYFNTLVNRH
jgi:two-component system OmpR family response regulator